MTISFHKYHGTGNDFIMIDNRQMLFNAERDLIEAMCNRRFGIGADGLILLNESPGYDFEMVYFNADGQKSSMCGNGGRCITAFANELGLVIKEARFLAFDGEHQATIKEINRNVYTIAIKMNDVDKVDQSGDDLILDTGSPHYVKFVKNLDQYDVFNQGRSIRNSNRFLINGININFVEKKADQIAVRTYERGVEDETYSCGSGIIASAIAVAMNTSKPEKQYVVQTRGGELIANFEKVGKKFLDIWLEGQAEHVYSGEIKI
ncbi:diaminopimelate epimerase [Bacteroidota bacterium]